MICNAEYHCSVGSSCWGKASRYLLPSDFVSVILHSGVRIEGTQTALLRVSIQKFIESLPPEKKYTRSQEEAARSCKKLQEAKRKNRCKTLEPGYCAPGAHPHGIACGTYGRTH